MATNSALNSFPFSGTIAVNQYLSVIPSQPFELFIENFSFSMSSKSFSFNSSPKTPRKPWCKIYICLPSGLPFLLARIFLPETASNSINLSCSSKILISLADNSFLSSGKSIKTCFASNLSLTSLFWLSIYLIIFF